MIAIADYEGLKRLTATLPLTASQVDSIFALVTVLEPAALEAALFGLVAAQRRTSVPARAVADWQQAEQARKDGK